MLLMKFVPLFMTLLEESIMPKLISILKETFKVSVVTVQHLSLIHI